jgi:autotransporter adhesin
VASGDNAIAIGNGAQATQFGSIAMGLNSASTGANSIAIGTGAIATGSVAVGGGAQASNGGAAFGDNAVATGTNSAALGFGATATAANSVAIGSGSVANQANTVSVGAPGAERRITNVAPGIAPNDAATVGQLNSVATGLQSQLATFAAGFTSQLDAVQTEARRGIAAAAAANGYMMPSGPGRTTIQVAGAFFHDEGAVGITAAHRLNFATPVVIFGSYANGGGSEHLGKVGAGFEF